MSAVSVIPVSVLSLMFLVVSMQAMSKEGEALTHAVKDSRYVTAQIGPTDAQTDVLQSVVRLTMSSEITTVGEALQYLLKPYGYQLDDGTDRPEPLDMYVLLSRPLPQPHRQLGPITLRDALDALGGDSFDVAINPVLRTVRYQLRSGLKDYLSANELEKAKIIWLEKDESTKTTEQSDSSAAEVIHYGPVKPGDTLSGIVSRLGTFNLTFDQTLVHVFRANNDAFINGNMNHLMIGEYLSVPPVNDDGLSPLAASKLVDEHYDRWLQRVQP